MFELTNEQRQCFGLTPVADDWERVKVKPSPYDNFSTFAYLEGNKIQKVILICESNSDQALYQETQTKDVLSEDRTMILPKTEKGKPRLFSSSNLLKGTIDGMYFCYNKGCVTLANGTSQQTYYQSEYEGLILEDFSALEKWIEEWCAGTGAKERKEILEFSAAGRVHQKYREGDFFRFRINRSLYGYGKILLDFNKMRKEKAPFWDIFMGKPICAAVYHIVTERKDVRPEELEGLAMLPSQMVMDNNFFYGEYVIIGNQPVPEDCQNYPIHYGNTIRAFDTGIRYQCGKTFIAQEDKQALYSQYRNNGIGWNLGIKLSVLQKCIEANSNQPYWDEDRQPDLRNPRFHEHLREIQEQIGING